MLPCCRHTLEFRRRFERGAGGGRLEFMVVVSIVSVLLAVFLGRVSEVHIFARDALATTSAAQARSIKALGEARAPLQERAAASAPQPITPTPAQAPSAAAKP